MAKQVQQRKPEPKNNLLRIGLIGVAILLFTVIALAFFRSKTEAPKTVARPITAPVIPKATVKAPPANTAPTNTPMLKVPAKVLETSFPVLDAKPRRLTDYAGKVVVVDIWATWCGPCRVEIPHLIELGQEFKGQGVEIIGLTTEDPAKDTEKVRDFVKEFKINYPIGFANGEFAAHLQQGRNAIPQTYVIGRDGEVYKHFVGFNAQISPAQLRAAVGEAVAKAK